MPQEFMRTQRGIAIASFCCVLGCADEIHKQRVLLADSAVVTGGTWAQVSAPEPLRTTAFHHEVCFTPLAPSRLSEQPMGIVDQHGTPVSVQVTVSDGDGTLELPLSGYMDHQICFGVHDTELDRQFNEVQLFASSTLTVQDLRWLSTDK